MKISKTIYDQMDALITELREFVKAGDTEALNALMALMELMRRVQINGQ